MANVATNEEVQALKRAGCAQRNAGALEWQQAGFSRQQVGSWLSFSVLGCQCTGAEENAAFCDFSQSAKFVLVQHSLGV
jgi:hypothetical protein